MPTETILVVDDAPVNLKLTDILLRKEGYKVHAAVDAEQALSLLRSLHPDLMLVDIQLPGMDGLELTRRIKQDSSTRDIVVVALTACAMKGDDDKAYRAGCDGYITKPIETLTLGKKVREFLDRRTLVANPTAQPVALAPSVPRLPGGITLLGPEMESLRRRFLEEGTLQIRQMLDSLDRQFDIARAVRMVQDWSEAAAILEYPTIAILARETECYLSEPADTDSLQEVLTNLLIAFLEPPDASMAPVPDHIFAALNGKRIALVGFAEEECERLCTALERASARPRLFDAEDAARDTDAIKDCSIAMVNVRPETRHIFLLGPNSPPVAGQPLVLAGPRAEILSLDSDIQARAREFLVDVWQPEEALLRLAHSLAAKQPEAESAPALKPTLTPNPHSQNADAEVLIADDDLTVRMLIRAALQHAGIKCRMASNGDEALQMIRDTHPRAAVLDINMPGLDGYEVLATLRNESIPVRVLLLTARQQEADITRGFTLGADDYMIKPFNPSELVARVQRFLWQ